MRCALRALFAVSMLAIGISGPATPEADAGGRTARRIIRVHDTEALYAEVNGAPASGSLILLAPGVTYKLTATGPAGPRPNKGRLDFPPHTDLIGAPGAVIDAGDLPPASYRLTDALTPVSGALRVGLGNTIAGITLVNGKPAPPGGSKPGAALLEIDRRPVEIGGLPGEGGLRATVVGNTFRDGPRGVDARHLGAEANGLESRIVIAWNTATGMANAEAGQGFRVIITGGTTGSHLRVWLHHNVSRQNQIGFLSECLNSGGNIMEVYSSDNVYEDNGLGTYVAGGGSNNSNLGLPGNNEVVFVSRGDAIRANDAPSAASFSPRGGAWVIGAGRATPGANPTLEVNDNRVHASFIDTRLARYVAPGVLDTHQNRLADGSRRDLTFYGALNRDGAIFPGSRNLVEVCLDGVDIADGGVPGSTTLLLDQFPPPPPDGDNHVVLTQCPEDAGPGD